ncbi:phosphopantheine-transferase PgaX [Streptomyces gobitricini]|uniref:Uncharacterized protein n=1 Tax=Streptomyces gobitricini TaxID=68211 RepID=A0ABN3N0D0_9ACTN
MNGLLDLWTLRLVLRGTARQPAPGAWPGVRPGAGYADDSALDQEARGGAGSFADPADRTPYRGAHTAPREVIGAYTGYPRSRAACTREPCRDCGGPHGHPSLATARTPAARTPAARTSGARTSGGAPPRFSPSHPPGTVLIAVVSERAGADVRLGPGPQTADVCAASPRPAERVEVRRAGASGRRRVSGRIPARKEAYPQGLGTDLVRYPAAGCPGDPEPDRWPADRPVPDAECGPRHDAAAVARAYATEPPSTRLVPVDVLADGHRPPRRRHPSPGPSPV